MKTYEYKIMEHRDHIDHEFFLNQEGKAGWELVSAIHTSKNGVFGMIWLYYFKRELI